MKSVISEHHTEMERVRSENDAFLKFNLNPDLIKRYKAMETFTKSAEASLNGVKVSTELADPKILEVKKLSNH